MRAALHWIRITRDMGEMYSLPLHVKYFAVVVVENAMDIFAPV